MACHLLCKEKPPGTILRPLSCPTSYGRQSHICLHVPLKKPKEPNELFSGLRHPSTGEHRADEKYFLGNRPGLWIQLFRPQTGATRWSIPPPAIRTGLRRINAAITHSSDRQHSHHQRTRRIYSRRNPISHRGIQRTRSASPRTICPHPHHLIQPIAPPWRIRERRPDPLPLNAVCPVMLTNTLPLLWSLSELNPLAADSLWQWNSSKSQPSVSLCRFVPHAASKQREVSLMRVHAFSILCRFEPSATSCS